jgi:glycosyltransferase involved in cell wall biosynthesis
MGLVVVMKKMKVVIALNTAWNLLNFRAGLIKAMLAEGHEVVAVAPHDEYADRVRALGCRFVALPMDNQGTNPLRDTLLWWRYRRLLKTLRPDVFLGFTVKPNVYGSLAARSLGIAVINNIAGLGSVFNKNNWLTALVRRLYRLALSGSAKVFFQNQDDLDAFVAQGLVNPRVVGLLPGSGVDLTKFQPVPNRPEDGRVVFLLIARMLWDKGVGEYVQAAAALKAQHPNAEFALLGFLDAQNPTAIGRAQMDDWVSQGAVSYWGVSDDVRQALAKVDVVVLPSYREGTPRTLLEAAAMAKPLVTTNAVGCRDVVDEGVNGYLCEVANAPDLARAMGQMLALTPEERHAMGQQGRLKVERFYDERFVVYQYLGVLSNIQ